MSKAPIPFCLPLIEQEEIDEVVECMKSGWITTGPRTKRFEEMLAEYVGCKHIVAVNSCTAALHLSLLATGVKPGDEVITTPLTFAATVNTILHVGAVPVLADIDPATGNIDPEQVKRKISPKTRAIVPVHYAGLACDLDALNELARGNNLIMIEDGAHAIGTKYKGRQVGADSQVACYSFYPIKNMTTVEGGAIATNDDQVAARARCYGLHGMSKDAWRRYSSAGSWFYEITYPGFKYNMTDIQAAFGIPQLRKLEDFISIRRNYADIYRERLSRLDTVILPAHETEADSRHCYHLFVIRVKPSAPIGRDALIEALKDRGVGTSVNFIPLPMHPYYRNELGWAIEDFPRAQEFYSGALSLPLYPKMSPDDVHRVCDELEALLGA